MKKEVTMATMEVESSLLDVDKVLEVLAHVDQLARVDSVAYVGENNFERIGLINLKVLSDHNKNETMGTNRGKVIELEENVL